MRSPTLALSWQVWWRYRWGLAACAVVWLVLAALGLLLPHGAWSPLTPESEPLVPVAVVVLWSFAPTFLFVIYAFSGIPRDAPIDAPESGFTTRTFTLPVNTATLVALPMLQGMAAVIVTWVAWAGAVLRPAGLDVTLVFPAVLTANLLAWLQAAVWWPFPLRFLRIIVGVVVLTIFATAPLYGLALGTPPEVVTGVLAAFLPAAYAVAVVGVARTRRGDVPTWTWPSRQAKAVTPPLPRRVMTFSSPLHAQSWFEWRMCGWGFPLMVGLILVPWMLLVLTGKGEMIIDDIVSAEVSPGLAAAVGALTAPGLLLILLLPILLLLAGVSGIEMGGTRLVGQKLSGATFGCHPFIALRPLTDGELVLAKLRTAVRATLTGWALVILAIFLCLGLTGKWRVLAGAPLLQSYGVMEVCGWLAAGLAGLVLLTWLLLVGNLWIRLTGRPWLINSISIAAVVAGVSLCLLGNWLSGRPDLLAVLAAALPYLAAGAVVLKLLLAGWLTRALRQRKLVTPRVLATSAAAWVVAAAGAVALLGRLLPSDRVSFSTVVLGVVLALPLNRFAVAPLALEWNRHR